MSAMTDLTALAMAEAQRQLNLAVMYALREGCFFPVQQPPQGASVRELIQWGAMRHLHEAIRNFNKANGDD